MIHRHVCLTKVRQPGNHFRPHLHEQLIEESYNTPEADHTHSGRDVDSSK